MPIKLLVRFKLDRRKARQVQIAIQNWLVAFPKNPFKSIPLDCRKEVSNRYDSAIFFVDPSCPGQSGLKEPSNGFLRKYGLSKQMDFAKSDQTCEAGQKVFKIIKTHPIRCSKTLIGCLLSWKDLLDLLLKLSFCPASTCLIFYTSLF